MVGFSLINPPFCGTPIDGPPQFGPGIPWCFGPSCPGMNWACLNSIPCTLTTRTSLPNTAEDRGGLCEDESHGRGQNVLSLETSDQFSTSIIFNLLQLEEDGDIPYIYMYILSRHVPSGNIREVWNISTLKMYIKVIQREVSDSCSVGLGRAGGFLFYV